LGTLPGAYFSQVIEITQSVLSKARSSVTLTLTETTGITMARQVDPRIGGATLEPWASS